MAQTTRHNSDSRSESAARTVTSVSIHPETLPAPGDVKIVPASTGYKAILNTGELLGFVEAYGRSEIEAHDAALHRAAELFVAKERREREIVPTAQAEDRRSYAR
jgi:hypothetical protein